jgi:phytoene dehydrogenase-like protein
MKCGIRKIHTDGTRATALTLDNGERITADTILSTAGVVETLRLCDDHAEDSAADNIGRLSFTETITVLDQQPRDLGWNDTIIFFNTRERFHYAAVEDALVDPSSGVICLPNNYDYGLRQLDEGLLRITAMANHDRWCALDATAYQAEKDHWYAELQKVALQILPDLPNGDAAAPLDAHCIAKDMFTPRTVRKYTGHLNGAIYGAPKKSKEGRTHLQNLYLAGTDQGFLGIVGAMLSGISMTNLHLLQDR